MRGANTMPLVKFTGKEKWVMPPPRCPACGAEFRAHPPFQPSPDPKIRAIEEWVSAMLKETQQQRRLADALPRPPREPRMTMVQRWWYEHHGERPLYADEGALSEEDN